MKLSHKLFSVYLVVSFLLLLLVGITFEFYKSRHFQEMQERRDNDILTILSYELALEYQHRSNWDEFKNTPADFETFVQTGLRNNENSPLFKAFQGPKIHLERPFPPDRPNPPGSPDPLILPHHPGISLSKIFYTVGIIVFVLAGLVSYGMSRHILSPVNQLMEGTKALSGFRFDTRIDVRTKDELGLLAQNFNRMAGTLETYETMRKQWVVDVSHELRTPLSILKGEIEAIIDGIRPCSMERMESVHSEIIYLEHMINDLYFLSLADASALTMRTESVRPVEILKNVLSIFETRFDREGLKIITRLTCEKEEISGDKDRIRQLFMNLMDNNLKYTQKPGKLSLEDRIENRVLMIYLEDSGPGVPPDAADKLFDRLYRVDRSRKRDHGGSGLGLSICKTIVSAHNGHISAQNTEGSGLKITILFPLT